MNNTIVAEIHSSFAEAEKELLQEARGVLKDAEDTEKTERAEQLTRMGFGSAKPVRLLSKEEQARAEELLFLKERYTRIAPQYKFITEDKLFGLCKKYGLVVGSSERYVQDIPVANQEDITNFKILDESFLEVNDDMYRNAEHTTKDGKKMHPKEMATSHIINYLTMMRRKYGNSDNMRAYWSKADVESIPVDLIRAMVTELALRNEDEALADQKKLWITNLDWVFHSNTIEELFTPLKSTYFYVAADIDSFDTEGAVLEENKLVEKNNNKEIEEAMKEGLFRYYDPIVLAKVSGGYLIVTAWGEEASDPDVVNPTRN